MSHQDKPTSPADGAHQAPPAVEEPNHQAQGPIHVPSTNQDHDKDQKTAPDKAAAPKPAKA